MVRRLADALVGILLLFQQGATRRFQGLDDTWFEWSGIGVIVLIFAGCLWVLAHQEFNDLARTLALAGAFALFVLLGVFVWALFVDLIAWL